MDTIGDGSAERTILDFGDVHILATVFEQPLDAVSVAGRRNQRWRDGERALARSSCQVPLAVLTKAASLEDKRLAATCVVLAAAAMVEDPAPGAMWHGSLALSSPAAVRDAARKAIEMQPVGLPPAPLAGRVAGLTDMAWPKAPLSKMATPPA